MRRYLILVATLALFLNELRADVLADVEMPVTERVIGPEIGPRYKHPASIAALDDGTLVIVYHGGSGEYEDDTAVYAVRQAPGETGWSRPKIVADTPFHGDGNAVVWQGPAGRVWLFYVVRYGKTWSDSRILAKVSDDGARTWSDSFVVAFEPGMMVRNRPIRLLDGDYLLPIYHEKGNDPEFVSPESTSLFLRYHPADHTWTQSQPVRSRIGNIQPGVVEVSPDTLACYARRGGGYDGRPDGFIVYSESSDGGRTWSPGQDTEFPNPNAAIDLMHLGSGRLLLIYNDSHTDRTPLRAALSTDRKTFPHRRNLAEGKDDFAYPFAVQTKDERIHVVYTSQERTVVSRVTFTEQWLLAANGESASPRNSAAEKPPRHVIVFAEPGRFGGWPANHGIWSWGDEILVGFSAGYHKDNGPDRHAIDHDRPEHHLLARSLDGGASWAIENPADQGALIPAGDVLHGIAPPGLVERPWQDCPGDIDFSHPDFAFTARMTSAHTGPARFYYSLDRGHRWQGPFRLPPFEQPGIAARTDYLVTGKNECYLFLTAAKPNGREGRPLCVKTTDGGRTWQFVSWIAPEPAGYAIMPSTVRLGEREFLTAIRCRDDQRAWIETYRSQDSGLSWTRETSPGEHLGPGNPASMVRLADGRLAITYGRREPPYGIRARLSDDNGQSWQDEIVLRDDGGGQDVGYPRTVQRPDGKLVSVYYFHDRPQSDRYIAATIWDAGVQKTPQ